MEKYRITKTVRKLGNYKLDKPIRKGGIVLVDPTNRYYKGDMNHYRCQYVGCSGWFAVPVDALERL